MSEVLAGKIGVTNGGEWNAETYYEEATFVRHQNNLYLSNLPSTGIEPTNEEYWMLAMEGFSGEDVQTLIDSINNIINGTTQVGNAKTLDGHEAEYFAPLSDLAKYLPLTGGTVVGEFHVEYNGIRNSVMCGALHNAYLSAKNNVTGNIRQINILTDEERPNIVDSLMYENFNGDSWVGYHILHTGNKPTGTYTGNGSATPRTINIGGIGGVLWVVGNNGSSAIVGSDGAFGKTGATNKSLVGSVVAFIDGALSMATADEMINASGVTYTYHVI